MLALIFILLWVVLMAVIILIGNIDYDGSDQREWYALGVRDGQNYGKSLIKIEDFRGQWKYWMMFIWLRNVLKAYDRGIVDGILFAKTASK